VLVVVGHRERKALIVRVGCGMARRGRGRLLGGPVFWRELVSASEWVGCGLKGETNVRVSTKSPASVENVGGGGGGESFGVGRRKRQ